jgi:hypothetical protein
MKKIIAIAIALCAALTTKAQGTSAAPDSQRQLVINGTVIIVIYLVSAFILKAIKSIQDYRLKNKIIEKGLPGELAAQYLRADMNEDKNQTIKIVCVLAGAVLGLSLIGFFAPPLITMLAIMSFSIAAGFLAYYIYLKMSSAS